MEHSEFFSFLTEVMNNYGMAGLLLIVALTIFVVVVYKFGPKIVDHWDELRKKHHKEQLQVGLERAPKVQSILRKYLNPTHIDHLFVGELHNGTTGVGGVPYLKFDVIYDQINPNYHGLDNILTYRYENEHVLAHDQLPGILVQNKYVYYKTADLDNIDENLYISLKSRKICGIALHVIVDGDGYPVGFLGGLNFTEEYDENQFKQCARELEDIYINELVELVKKKKK